MRLIKSVTLDIGIGAEVLSPILTSTTAEKYHIIGVLSEKVENLRLRVYHEREMIWDVDSLLLPAYVDFVPLDLELPVGDVLYVGFKNETGAAVTGEDVGVVYEIVP